MEYESSPPPPTFGMLKLSKNYQVMKSRIANGFAKNLECTSTFEGLFFSHIT